MVHRKVRDYDESPAFSSRFQNLAGEHGRIRRADVAELCKISNDQAKRLLKSLTEKHAEFKQKGVFKGTHYIWDTNGT